MYQLLNRAYFHLSFQNQSIFEFIKMKFTNILFSFLAITVGYTAASKHCAPFPPTMEIFTSGFEEPIPPTVKSAYNTSFIQHKWYQPLSA